MNIEINNNTIIDLLLIASISVIVITGIYAILILYGR